MFSWFSLMVGRSALTSKHITVQFYYVRTPLHLLIHTHTLSPEAADTIPDWIMIQRTKIFQLQLFYDKKIIAVWSWKHFSIINSLTTSKSLTLPVSRGRMAMNVNLDRNLVNANDAALLRTVRIRRDAYRAYLLISGHELLNGRQRFLK